ncbi:MAG: hypothetical protein KUG65_12195, partial [Sphingomonadaceae bacterium]|nr:hypothetical protein [Sphingomonadaceae bacterium]
MDSLLAKDRADYIRLIQIAGLEEHAKSVSNHLGFLLQSAIRIGPSERIGEHQGRKPLEMEKLNLTPLLRASNLVPGTGLVLPEIKKEEFLPAKPVKGDDKISNDHAREEYR